jgi:hypothetical protein
MDPQVARKTLGDKANIFLAINKTIKTRAKVKMNNKFYHKQ